MKVNPIIRTVLKEISTQSVKYSNTKDEERKYIKRLYDIFVRHLNEEEKIFILKIVLESIHYKNIITDPDNIVQLHNIKLRNISYIFLLVLTSVIIILFLFIEYTTIKELLVILNNINNMLNI